MRSLHRVALSAACVATALLLVRASATAPGARSGSGELLGAAAEARGGSAAVRAGAAAQARRGATARAAPAATARERAAAPARGLVAATPQRDARHSEAPRPADALGSGSGSGKAPRAPAIELDPLALGDVTARVSGFDPLGPRALLLWRRVGSRVAVMARGRSRADGSLEFPSLVVPDAGLEVLVTAADAAPGDEGASLPRSVAPREPVPPRARLLAQDGDGWTLRILPAEPGGEILLAGSDGAVFARRALPPHPFAPGRVFDLALTLLPGDTEVWLSHARADGRQSAWTRVELPHAGSEENP